MDLYIISEILTFIYFVHVSIKRSFSTISEEYLTQADFIVSLNGGNWSEHKNRDHWSIDSRKY